MAHSRPGTTCSRPGGEAFEARDDAFGARDNVFGARGNVFGARVNVFEARVNANRLSDGWPEAPCDTIRAWFALGEASGESLESRNALLRAPSMMGRAWFTLPRAS